MKTEDECQNGEYENCYQSLRGQQWSPKGANVGVLQGLVAQLVRAHA